MPVLIAEQHVQDWTSNAIVAYLRARGYEVRDWHVTQDLEAHVPTDWIFVDQTRLKVFGLQYKALYSNGEEHWLLERDQHIALQRFPWVHYCVSEIQSPKDKARALASVRIYASDIPYRRTLSRRGRNIRYLRWPGFFRAFESCLLGHRVRSRKELRSLLGKLRGTGPLREARHLVEYFFADIEGKRAVRVRAGRTG
jgi:hypothetical protein